jgi:4-amino-4-deoxy-L-arabinose transferase-like glycosyltransferase
VRRGPAYAIVVAACVLPRAIALVYERGAILGSFVEKSDILARVFIQSGTFGYVPGVPTANTQPLYGWFLIPIYWIAGRHWWSVGTVQIAVATATAIVVYETGRRFLSPWAGLIAAVVSTLHPYLVWHDVHVNREILDQLLGAAMFFLTLLVARRRSWWLVAALGVVSGVAILSNARLLFLPIALGAFLLWRRSGWLAAVVVPVLAGITLLPWLVRNDVQVGCFTLTTDSRALWKANNLRTYGLLKRGLWIDTLDSLPGEPYFGPTPTQARDFYLSRGKKINVHECYQQKRWQHLVIQFWKNHPGAKARLMVQATELLWSPEVTADSDVSGSGAGGVMHQLRHLGEPAFMIPLYALAIVGLFLVPTSFWVLALIFFGYETFAAWVFAGTTRYRVPWDFVLALLAAATLTRIPWRRWLGRESEATPAGPTGAAPPTPGPARVPG